MAYENVEGIPIESNYQKEYYIKNKDRINEKNKRNYYKNHEKVLQRQKMYNSANREKIRETRRNWYRKNHEKELEEARQYHMSHRELLKEKQERYYLKNLENILIRNKKWRTKWKMEVFTHYGGNPPKCSCCGEKHIEFLTIDHINGGGRKHLREIHKHSIYRWLILNKFPKEFRVLCINCNFSLGKFGYCPHQTIVNEVV